ncbi:MAG: nitrous oxide reductase accessory protein NosL [Persicimonas sp.]
MKKTILIAAFFALAIGALVYVLERPTDGVEPIVWDQATCAHCHMHIGDPHYAAQIHTADGRVLNFDDPGCLFEYVEQNRLQTTAAYFHHYREDRWLSRDEAGFIEVDEDTPMGYGIGAVDRVDNQDQHPDMMSFEGAKDVVLRSGRLEQEESR